MAMYDFFNGFGDELLKIAGPMDWAKRKLGFGKTEAPKVEEQKVEEQKTEVPKVEVPKTPKAETEKPIYRTMGSGQKGLKAEGVFGATR